MSRAALLALLLAVFPAQAADVMKGAQIYRMLHEGSG